MLKKTMATLTAVSLPFAGFAFATSSFAAGSDVTRTGRTASIESLDIDWNSGDEVAVKTQAPTPLAAPVADSAPDADSAPVAASRSARSDSAAPAAPVATSAEYSLAAFMSAGVVNWGGYKFTYYSQQVLPGGGLAIPGRHVNAGGYVADSDGYIVLAGSAPKGTVYATPFGAPGKIYDRGTVGNHLDVYVR